MLPLRRNFTNVVCRGELKLLVEYTNTWRPVRCHLTTCGLFEWRDTRNRRSYVDVKAILPFFVYGELLLQLPRLPQPISEIPLELLFAMPRMPSRDAPLCFFMCRDAEVQNTWVRNIIQAMESSHFTRPMTWKKATSNLSDSGSSYQSSTMSSVTLPLDLNPRKCKSRQQGRHQKTESIPRQSTQSKNVAWFSGPPNLWHKPIAIPPLPACRTYSCQPAIAAEQSGAKAPPSKMLTERSAMGRIVFDRNPHTETPRAPIQPHTGLMDFSEKKRLKMKETPKWLVHQFVGIAWTKQRAGR